MAANDLQVPSNVTLNVSSQRHPFNERFSWAYDPVSWYLFLGFGRAATTFIWGPQGNFLCSKVMHVPRGIFLSSLTDKQRQTPSRRHPNVESVFQVLAADNFHNLERPRLKEQMDAHMPKHTCLCMCVCTSFMYEFLSTGFDV